MAILDYFPKSTVPLIEPGFLLYYAIEAYVLTLLSFLRQGKLPSDLRGKAFGRFWSFVSGAPPDPAVPLAGSATLVPPLLRQATGKVLEIGPGSGNQTGYYTPAAGQISAIYGAEPATELHQLLRKNVDATELAKKYVILNADASRDSVVKELVRQGIVANDSLATGMFDTIVCVRVLCSVPNLTETITGLHSLLRPGGKLFIVEHTVNPWQTPKGSMIARLFQTLYMLLGWSYFVGDCSLVRDIESELRKDAKKRWASIDLERHFGKVVITYISGILVKAT